ncbi:Helicase associated domain [Seminavis robusta]|uniref:Helicase associated domain n=1 Tax=Seminavis robusta TaxID=568900 RepID=A0A9N8H5X9_9STRA|nr:Helicase associated domain [Seminavis robusta]|eukprot:Sro85_g045220.1 Helicase associated domain (547) ;mRNA; r:30249-31990
MADSPAAPTRVASPLSSKPSNKHRTWDENYAELLVYKQMYGNCDVPYGYKRDPVLGKWISHLRENQDQPLMSPERKAALNAIGFTWNPLEKRWNDMYAKLKAYHEQFGTTKVPTHYKEDRTLGKWVKRQRENYNSGILQEHRKQKLDALQFVWKLSEREKPPRKSKANLDQWKKQYDALCLFKAEFGHTNVPKTYEKDPSLGKWVSKQRLQNNRNLLDKDRKKLLDDVGFVFSFQAQKKQQEWNRMYELLKACQASAGTSNGSSPTEFQVPKTGPDASSVARWVQRQREKYRQDKMDPGREVLLRKLNFPFPEQENTDENSDSTPSSVSEASQQHVHQAPLQHMHHHHHPHQDVVSVVVDAMHREDDQAAEAAGKEIAHCIDVLAKYMSTTPTDLAARLPVSNKPRPRGPAFGRIMPLIVALRDAAAKWGGTANLKDASFFLDQVLRQEKGLVALDGSQQQPQTQREGSYHELLSLAVDLGSVLDQLPAKQANSVLQSCEVYLQHLVRKITGEKASVHEVSSPSATTDDDSTIADRQPRAKRAKLS